MHICYWAEWHLKYVYISNDGKTAAAAEELAAGAAAAPIEIRSQGGRCLRIQGQPWRDEEGYSVCRVLWFDAESAGEGVDSADDDDIVFDDDEGSGAVSGRPVDGG